MFEDDNAKLATAEYNPVMTRTNEKADLEYGQGKKSKAPNSIHALVFGALSLSMVISSLYFSLFGFIDSFSYKNFDRITAFIMIIFEIISLISAAVLALIGRMKTKNGYRQYEMSPDSYFGVGMLKAGKIMSLVGLILCGVALLTVLLVLAVYYNNVPVDSGYIYY